MTNLTQANTRREEGIMFKVKNTNIEVIEFSFKENQGHEKDQKFTIEPEFVGETGKLTQKKYYTQLAVGVKNREDKPFPVDIHVVTRAVFDIDNVEDETKVEKFLEKQGVHVLFPYLRSTLSSITSIAMIPPIVLPIIDASKFFERIRKDKQT